MKKLFKFLLIIILLPVVIIVGAVTYLKFADLNPYRPDIEKLLRKYANIDVKINGDLDIGISLKPSIELNDVIVSLPEAEYETARIGNALVQFSILPLLHKEIVVDTIETTDTKIFYNPKDSVNIKELVVSMDNYDAPIGIIFDTNISGIDIAGTASVSSLKDLQASKFNETELTLIDTTVMGYTIGFSGWLRGLQEKIRAEGDYDVKYKSNRVYGSLNADLTQALPYVKMDIQSDKINVADFTAPKQASNNFFIGTAQAAEKNSLDIPYEYLKMANADVSFDVKTVVVEPKIVLQNLKGSANLKDGVLKATVNKLNFNDNSITGEAKLEQGKLPYVKVSVSGSAIDLTKLASNTKTSDGWLVKNAYASQLMKNIDIPYQYLKMANANMALNLKTLILTSDVKLSDIQINAALLNGSLNTNIKNITAGTGTIKGTIILSAKDKTLSTDLTGSNILLQKLYTPYADPNNPQMYVKSGGKTNFLIKTHTSGNNTDQYLNNLNGQIIAFIDESVLKIRSLERLQGNIIMQILNALKISDLTKKDTDLACAVVRSDIKDGTMSFPKGIVFNATDFYLVADGTLNLKNDKIRFDLQPFSGKLDSTNISSILGSLLKIAGTVNNPKIDINQTSAAKNVVGFLASGGAYNVGDMLLSADSVPCHTALSGTTYASYFKGDDSVKGNVSKSYGDVKDGIKNVGQNLKNVSKDIKNQAKELGNQLKGLFSK
ncbi:MAG: AsmA family protein [Alphaproteobacteria bacterium]|nr:AsmA family protein [Alphaproteobacteria bacterium]